jgi:hypothetical protein
MRAICRAWCFLFGHKVFAPSARVQACHFGHDAREWNMPGFTAREFTGIVRWPLYLMCWSVRDLVKTLERRIFCHQTELMNILSLRQSRTTDALYVERSRANAYAEFFTLIMITPLEKCGVFFVSWMQYDSRDLERRRRNTQACHRVSWCGAS